MYWPGYVIGQDADNSDVPLVESIKSLAKLLGGGGPRIMKKYSVDSLLLQFITVAANPTFTFAQHC